ncbi:MAG: hypothetical protein WD225_10300 [Ilumatobacteraceae bacterium]
MKRSALSICAVAALTFTAVGCGDDDGDSSPQGQVAQQLIDEAEADGMGVDESCVREATSELSDSDAQALIDDDEEALSAEGGLALFGMLECIDLDLGDLDLDELEDLDLDN